MKKLEVLGVEDWREYVYDDGFVYRVSRPAVVHVSDTGSHRVTDDLNITHYIPAGWRVIRWSGEVIA